MRLVFEDLRLRSLSALIMLSFLFFCVFVTPFFLVPSLWILNLLLLREVFNLYGLTRKKFFQKLLIFFICIFPLYFSQHHFLSTIFFNILIFFYFLISFKSKSLGFFTVYINLAISCLISLLSSSSEVGGISFFLIFVLAVAFSDIGGYFGGRLIRGPKVYKKISPNKTWAGIISGWILVVVFYQILKMYGVFRSDYFVYIFFGIALSSQVGDFIESNMKRKLGVKDTDRTIPGHGGLLDRFDGMICASFFVKLTDIYLTI